MNTTYRIQSGAGFGTMHKPPQVSKTVFVAMPASSHELKNPVKRGRRRVYKGVNQKRKAPRKRVQKKTTKKTTKKRKTPNSKKRAKVTNF